MAGVAAPLVDSAVTERRRRVTLETCASSPFLEPLGSTGAPVETRFRRSLRNLVSEGIMTGLISPCPVLPVCVCSRRDALPRHRIEPIAGGEDAVATFARVRSVVTGMPRTVVVTAKDDYLHAVCRSWIGFVDDLECQLCLAEHVIHIRSASRFGIWDFGANRARVEAIRRLCASG